VELRLIKLLIFTKRGNPASKRYLQEEKLMCKSKLQATFTDYFKFMKDVHPHNMRHTKTLQFALQKARSNSVNENVEVYCNRNLVTQTPLETKNKPSLALFAARCKKYVTRLLPNIVDVLPCFVCVH